MWKEHIWTTVETIEIIDNIEIVTESNKTPQFTKKRPLDIQAPLDKKNTSLDNEVLNKKKYWKKRNYKHAKYGYLNTTYATNIITKNTCKYSTY